MHDAMLAPFRLRVWTPSDTQIAMERSFRAPRELVFRCFLEPEALARWWGPYGTRLRIEAHEPRVGGRWRFVCVDGADEYGFGGEFLEIAPHERIVQTFEFDGAPGHVSTESAEFHQEGELTRVTFLTTFANKAARDAMLSSGMEEGAGQSYDRLEAWLFEIAGAPKFEIVRRFDAPVRRVWEAWTVREQFARWWGPASTQNEVLEYDFRPGGRVLYRMVLPNGGSMGGMFLMREIVAPERFTYLVCFADDSGHVVRAPFAENWPLATHNVVTLSDLGGKTELRLESVPLTSQEGEAELFRSMFGSMQAGFGGTLDLLQAYLAGRE